MTDLPSRALTPREITSVRHIFGTDLDYSKVKVYKGKWAFWQGAGRAMTPDGNIYFPEGSYKEDFSLYKGDIVLLVHELTHAWQWQHGMMVKTRRVINGRYDYGKLDPKANFLSYGIEQQAAIVEDYARLKLGMTRTSGDGSLDDYWHVIPFLPKPRKGAVIKPH